jgi:hypothetical protein
MEKLIPKGLQYRPLGASLRNRSGESKCSDQVGSRKIKTPIQRILEKNIGLVGSLKFYKISVV